MIKTQINLPEQTYKSLKYMRIKKSRKSSLEMIAEIKCNTDVPKDFSQNYEKYLYGAKT